MKNVKTYNEFVETNEGFKDVAVGAAMTAASVLPSFGKGPGEKISDNTPRHKVETRYDTRKDMYIENGYTLDSIKLDTIYKNIKIKHPEQKIINHTIILENVSYGSGIFKLNEEQKEEILNVLDSISSQNEVVLKTFVESSTDKTPVGQGLIKQGIKDNKDLSQKRNDAVKDFLVELGMDVNIIEQNVLSDQGTKNDANARRVAITFSTVKVDLKTVGYTTVKTIDKINKTYYLSKEIKVGNPNYKYKKFVNNTVQNVQHRQAIKCPSIFQNK